MITLTFAGDVSPLRREAFERSAARWDEVVNTAFPPVEFDGTIFTGVRIDVTIEPIDGPAGILGGAGPVLLRADTELPLTGMMAFDSADVVRLEEDGSFEDVVLHEMAHVLGFGALWGRRNLLRGAGTFDPRFVGPSAAREFAVLDPNGGTGVPIANTGGAGTREGHWRELIFGDELLTGFLSGGTRPLSRVSIASFEDIGYEVDYARADPFELPTFRELALRGIPEAVRTCELCRMERTEPVVLRPPGP